MERPFICGGNKYTISPTNTIGLPVKLENLPKKVNVYGNTLFLKPTFHVSLFCINEIIKKHDIKDADFIDNLVKDFCEFSGRTEINLIGYKNEFSFTIERDLKTVVVFCNVSSLDKFFELINKKYNLDIEYPPTHVTLYAHDGKTGIFITDAEDVKNLTKPIPNPIGRSL